MPHARVDDLDKTIGLFFSPEGCGQFRGPDNRPVDLVFTIIIPEEATEEHL